MQDAKTEALFRFFLDHPEREAPPDLARDLDDETITDIRWLAWQTIWRLDLPELEPGKALLKPDE